MIVAFFKGRTFRVLVGLVVFLVLLPELLRFALIKAVPALGLGDISIDDVDLNVFTAEAAIAGLTLTRDQQPKLSIDGLDVNFSWIRLIKGDFHAESISAQGARLSAIQSESGGWELVWPLITAGDSNEVIEPLVLPRLSAEQIVLADAELSVVGAAAGGTLIVEKLQLEQWSSWQNQAMTIALKASWNLAPIVLTATVEPWKLRPDLNATLSVDGLPLDDLASLAGQPLSGFIDLNLTIDGERDEQGLIASHATIEWAIRQLSADYKNVRLSSQALSGQSIVEAQFGAATALEYTVQGDMASAGFRLLDIPQDVTLTAWEQLSFDALSLDEQLNASVESLVMRRFEAFKNPGSATASLSIGTLELTDLSLRDGVALSIDKLTLTDSQQQIRVLPDGQLAIQQSLAATLNGLRPAERTLAPDPDPDPNPSASASASTSPSTSTSTSLGRRPSFTLTLNQFEVTGESNLVLRDERYAVPVEQTLVIEQLTVTNLDQKIPAQAAQLVLAGKLGEFSTVAVQGDLTLFAEHPGVNIKGEFDAVELSALSPYSESYLGYHLSRGQYDHLFELIIDNEDISLDNKLFLRRLSLKAVHPDKPQPMERVLDVPLNFALDLLRDGDDNIKLDVPIRGRMDDPDVNINDVVNNALGTALKKGATSFLTLALQPYGAVLMAADFVNDKMSTVRLDPIAYPAGSDELNSEQQGYLAKIIGLLQQRPSLELTICSKTNDADKLALDGISPQQPASDALLLALADRRSNAIKRQMVEAGIVARRLFVCQPSYEPDADSAVSLTL